MSEVKSVISLEGITKSYQTGGEELQILKGIDLKVKEGEFLAIMGTSGSGKSTLMNIIGLLDRPSQGNYQLDEKEVALLSDKKLSQIRNQQIGFVFQQFFLLSKLDAVQNVELPLVYGKTAVKKRRQLANDLLDKVELSERKHHLPTELSGGQKQRVAIARALINQPTLILADEPTGALDSRTGEQIMELLTRLNQEGKTIVMVTHEQEIADYASRQIVIRDGQIISDSAEEVS